MVPRVLAVVLKREAPGISAVPLLCFFLTTALMTSRALCRKTLFPLPSELIATCTGNCGRRTLRRGAHFCPGQVLPCLGLLLFASWQGPLKLAGFQQFLLFGCHGLGRERLCPMSGARIPLHQGEAQGHGCHFPKAKWGLTKLIKSSF